MHFAMSDRRLIYIGSGKIERARMVLKVKACGGSRGEKKRLKTVGERSLSKEKNNILEASSYLLNPISKL
jgi:hypothetical protein